MPTFTPSQDFALANVQACQQVRCSASARYQPLSASATAWPMVALFSANDAITEDQVELPQASTFLSMTVTLAPMPSFEISRVDAATWTDMRPTTSLIGASKGRPQPGPVIVS